MFFNTFSFPQVFPQHVKKLLNYIIKTRDGYWGVPIRCIESISGLLNSFCSCTECMCIPLLIILRDASCADWRVK
jgi:hypothetical protein